MRRNVLLRILTYGCKSGLYREKWKEKKDFRNSHLIEEKEN